MTTEESALLLLNTMKGRGDSDGFGSMSNSQKTKQTSPKPMEQTSSEAHHQRLISNYTEISSGSNDNTGTRQIKRGMSAGTSGASNNSTVNSEKQRQKAYQQRFDRTWNILFDQRDAFLTNLLLGLCYTLVILYSILIFLVPFLLHFMVDKDDWCYSRLTDDQRDMFTPAGFATMEETIDIHRQQNDRDLGSGDFAATADQPYPNPDYNIDPCRYVRFPFLSYITLEECDICRRLLIAVILGGAIGYERRSADRPAGIRTMGLVSLGACFFTTSSTMAFKSSTQTWDASRVTAALPSGVGFLGGALIWKGSVFVGDNEMHQVHGLTTAASLWLSAAVGVGVGGALYLVTIYVTTLVIMILRYGPRIYMDIRRLEEDDDEDGHLEDDVEEEVDDEIDDDDDDHDEQEAADKYNNNDTTEFFIDEPASISRSSKKMTSSRLSSSRLSVSAQQSSHSRRSTRTDEGRNKLMQAHLQKSMKDIPTYGS